MDWILENVAVGDANDGLHPSPAEIVVNLSDEIPVVVGYDFITVLFFKTDPDRNPRPLVEMLAPLVKIGKKILIHCREGKNRAPAVVVCLLMGLGWEEGKARELLREKRPMSAPFEFIIERYKRG